MNYLIGHDRCGWQAARERKTQEAGKRRAGIFLDARRTATRHDATRRDATRRDATRVS